MTLDVIEKTSVHVRGPNVVIIRGDVFGEVGKLPAIPTN